MLKSIIYFIIRITQPLLSYRVMYIHRLKNLPLQYFYLIESSYNLNNFTDNIMDVTLEQFTKQLCPLINPRLYTDVFIQMFEKYIIRSVNVKRQQNTFKVSLTTLACLEYFHRIVLLRYSYHIIVSSYPYYVFNNNQ